MTEQRFGKVIARGTDAFVALIGQAMAECVNAPLQDMPLRDYVMEEHSPQEFRDQGYVFADGSVNEGRVVSAGLLWINSAIVARRPKRAKHIARHEVSHVIPLSSLKRAALMSKMHRRNGTSPTDWRGGAYRDRPYECFADTFAEAVSGLDSPWDDFSFYQLDVDDADVPLFVTIVTTPDAAPVPVPPAPQPLPPVDPRIELLEAEVKRLAGDLATANQRIKDKDAKFQEGLLL